MIATQWATGDFDGNGTLDLAITGPDASDENVVGILLGNGNGTFNAQKDSAADINGVPQEIVPGDFNGDHKLDLAVRGPCTLALLLGGGDGSFTSMEATSPTNCPSFDQFAMISGDLQNQGWDDLLISGSGTEPEPANSGVIVWVRGCSGQPGNGPSDACETPLCAPTCGYESQCCRDSDCGSGVCTGGECAQPSCFPSCANGDACGEPNECASKFCECTSDTCDALACAAAPQCAPNCADGVGCSMDSQCGSGICTDETCASPACMGSCTEGTHCGDNADCASYSCVASECVAP